LDGAVLHLLNVIMMNMRRKPLNISPGMDLLVPSPSHDAASQLILQDDLFILRKSAHA
jgi:hypothetical protein